MGRLTETNVFNNSGKIVEGWYWALQSRQLKKGKAKALNFLGRDLVLFRGQDGSVRAMDAYCPHMGAHLAEGVVEENDIRCLFHFWKYNDKGQCIEIPCQKVTSFVSPIRTWTAAEKYGLIWIWAGEASTPRYPVPFVPELEGLEVQSKLGKPFVKFCHPNVMMINAIDAQHFNSVHNIPVELNLEPHVHNQNWISFNNTTQLPRTHFFLRWASKFYRQSLTYILSYWYGSTGSVTVGPDFLHFHILFALRPTAQGRSEGQTILVTKARPGAGGRIWNHVLLFLTAVVGNYFAKGDTLIFKTIRFRFAHPIKADHSIISFIEHVEKQPTLAWGLESELHEAKSDSKAQEASNFELTDVFQGAPL